MKNGLFRFYFFFMILSMGLFSCENKVLSHDRKVMEEEEMKKEMTKPKRPFKHYSRSAHMC